MYVLTYSLKSDGTSSDAFYKDTEIYTEKLLAKGEALLGKYLDSYLMFFNSNMPYKNSRKEALLELLIMGVLWRVYSGDSQRLESLPQELLVKLSEIRSQNVQLKPGVDFLRGILSTLFLSPDLYDNLQISEPGLVQLDQLLDWLSATGEFSYETNRLRCWQRHLLTLPQAEAETIIAISIAFTIWFEDSSLKALGKYTENVDRYLNELRPKKYWREDVILCGRRRVEYHMNMVGAQIMNDAFKDEFHSKSKKLLLLPTCMKQLGNAKCKAESVGEWLKCMKCSNECPVSQIMHATSDFDVSVFMVSHESSISHGKNKGNSLNDSLGVIGVSCVLNLISGGWMLKSMGIPAQCVLLDYCGCKNHWHTKGFPTTINLNQLRKILTPGISSS